MYIIVCVQLIFLTLWLKKKINVVKLRHNNSLLLNIFSCILNQSFVFFDFCESAGFLLLADQECLVYYYFFLIRLHPVSHFSASAASSLDAAVEVFPQ